MAYDFISNIPVKIQEVIEDRNKEEILQWINANSLTAALLANSEADHLIDELTLDTISANSTVWHDSFTKHNILKTDFIESFGSPEISITEIGILETSFTKTSISKDGSAEIDVTESNLPENGVTKISPFHVTILRENTFIDTRSNEFSKAQISFDKATAIEIGIAEVGFSVDTTSNSFANPVSAPKVTASEIFFSPSVLSNQFFSIHNSTPQTIKNINSIAQTFYFKYPRKNSKGY